MNVIEPKVIHDFQDVIRGSEVNTSVKLYQDAKGFYRTESALADDTLMYEVYHYTQGDDKRAGNLNWGLTVLYPVLVNGECNMTRGHWHENRKCVEFYFCIAGEGLLMLMDEDGTTWAEKTYPGSLLHIDGHLAHRLINTGEEPMKIGACWPCDAGHDYAAVERQPFGYRVYKEEGTLRFEKVED